MQKEIAHSAKEGCMRRSTRSLSRPVVFMMLLSGIVSAADSGHPSAASDGRPALVDATIPRAFEHIAVCFQNERLIGKGSLKFTIDSLRDYEKALRAQLHFSCASPNSVMITFRELPARELPRNALGAARLRGSRILPEIEIFRAPVRRLLGVVPASIEGRAFAKIVAHELHHYLRQQTGHTPGGLNGEFYAPQDLMYGSEYFR